MRRYPGVLLLLSLILATPAAAQQLDPPINSLVPGARSLAFGRLGEGTSAIEYWRMRSAHTNQGLIVAFSTGYSRSTLADAASQRQSSGGAVSVSAGPAVRRYASVTERVNPFFYGHALVGYGYSTSQVPPDRRDHRHAFLGSVSTGVGLEWFPVPQISLSGQAGVRISTQLDRVEYERHTSENLSVGFSTFGAALMLNLYWPLRDG